MALAKGKVENCPFDAAEISSLKKGIVGDLQEEVLELGRTQGDREDVSIDFRFLGLLLRAAEDLEMGLGRLRPSGPCVAGGSRMPRLPALYRPKRRLASQTTPEHILENTTTGDKAWLRNDATCLRKFTMSCAHQSPGSRSKSQVPSAGCCVARCQSEGQAERRSHSESGR